MDRFLRRFEMYEYEILYYIVIEPRKEGAFRPVILDYGVYFDKATAMPDNGFQIRQRQRTAIIRNETVSE